MESKMFTILVDDEISLDVEFFQRCFEEMGLDYSFSHVSEKSEILTFIREHRPDLVFLNTHLSQSSTVDCLKSIKSDPEVANTPIVIYSTPKSLDEVREFLTLGAMRYLVKPIDAQGLRFGLEIIMFLVKTGQVICWDPEEFLINTNHRYFVY